MATRLSVKGKCVAFVFLSAGLNLPHTHLNFLNQLHLPWVLDKIGDNRASSAPNPPCAATTMNVISNVVREVIIDYMRYLEKKTHSEITGHETRKDYHFSFYR